MAEAGAIRAGRAFVELFADDSKLTRGLKAADAKLKAWGKGISIAGAGLFALGGAAIAFGVSAVKAMDDFRSHIFDLSLQTGIGTEALQELSFAAEQAGSNIEDFATAINKMQKFLRSNEASEGLSRIGLSLEQLQRLSPDEQFQRIAETIDAIDDPARRAASAMAIFGKAGARLLPMMEGLAEGRQLAKSLGIVASDADIRAAERFGDKLHALGTIVKMVHIQIGAALLPLANAFVKARTAGAGWDLAFLKENRALVTIAGLATLAITGLGIALIAIGQIVSFALVPFTMLIGVLKFLGITVLLGAAKWVVYGVSLLAALAKMVLYKLGSLAASASTLLFGTSLLSAAAAAIVAAIGVDVLNAALLVLDILLIAVIASALVLTGAVVFLAAVALVNAAHAAAQFGDSFAGAGERAANTWNMLRRLIEAGDLESAGRLAWASLKLVWVLGMGELEMAWQRFGNSLANSWESIWSSIVSTTIQAMRLINNLNPAALALQAIGLDPVENSLAAAAAGNAENQMRGVNRRAQETRDLRARVGQDADAARAEHDRALLDAEIAAIQAEVEEAAANAERRRLGIAEVAGGPTSGTFSARAAEGFGASIEERQLRQQEIANQVLRDINRGIANLQFRWG